jgi:UDP-N-acetylglucosamine:LPS N-acetylglucosamine transferase
VRSPRRVLILTSDTGAGHRSVSNALIEAARQRPEAGLALADLDPFRPLPPAPGGARGAEPAPGSGRSLIDQVVGLYGPIIVHAPWLWGLIFRTANNDVMLGAYLSTFGSVVLERVVAAAQRMEAEALVSVHPLVNHVMVRARRRLGRPVLPLLTVVTDLVDVHRWWAAPEIDQYVAGSDLAARTLEAYGVPPQKIAVLGIPIRREFQQVETSAREMRQRLRLDPDRTTILVMGGGDGAGGIVDVVRAIAALYEKGAPPFQLVVLAGRNERARHRLEARPWPVPVRVHGIVGNVAEHMIAADLIVTKPGSLTVSEALAVGRPLVLGRPLPGQEEGNVAYVVERGAGLHYRSPQEAADAVSYLLAKPDLRWEMGQQALRLSRPRSTERTLDLLQALMLRSERGTR